jgi:hypothetical protein
MTRTLYRASAVLLVAAAVACSREPDVESVPVGADVQVTRQDGGVVAGKLTEKDASTVKVVTGKTTRTVSKQDIADVKVVEADKPVPALPAIAKFREVTVPDNTALRLEIQTPVSSETSAVEAPVEARLTSAVEIDGMDAIPAGSIVRGNVASAVSAGKVKGRASLAILFHEIVVRDERVPISARWAAEAESTKKTDATKIGVGAGAGAVIGGILGGKKGAATGAVIGGGAGTAMVLTSEGKPVELGRGADITVRLANAIEVKVPVVK